MRRITTAVAALVLALAALVAGPGVAQAAAHHHNTLPYDVGCGGNLFVLSRHNIAGGTASLVYSRTCGTNWIEWYGPAVRTFKYISVNGNSTAPEVDYTRWAYSRQVYAPGNTPTTAYISVNSQEGWVANCASSCSWERAW